MPKVPEDDIPRERLRPAHEVLSLRLMEDPGTFRTGAARDVRLKIGNDSDTPAQQQRHEEATIRYRWLSPAGSPVAADNEPTRLALPLGSHASRQLRVTVVPPNTTGRYILELVVGTGSGDAWEVAGERCLRIECRVDRGEMNDFGDYLDAWARADLDRDHWEIVGPATLDEFRALGRHKLQLLVDRGLTPDSSLLDVGCGTGCLTEQVAGFLGPDGQYWGTDISPQAIAFCRARYPRRNFNFQVNAMTEVALPGVCFDRVALFSVFTHLYPGEIRDILRSLRRLLAPGGSVLADAFVAPDTPGTPPYAGHRAKVDIAEATLLAAFDDGGFPLRQVEQLADEGDVRRLLFELR